jgi:hypothetical protein
MVWGAATSARGEEVQNQTVAITTAKATLPNIRPNALRMFYPPGPSPGAINAKQVLTPPQREARFGRLISASAAPMIKAEAQ